MSKSRPAVANAMRLLSLPQEVQWLIEQGNLSAGHGRALSLPAPEEQIQFAGEIMEKGYLWVGDRGANPPAAPGPGPACPGAPRLSPLRLYYKGRRNVSSPRAGAAGDHHPGEEKRGKIPEYYDQEDLEGLMQALSALDTGKERRKP